MDCKYLFLREGGAIPAKEAEKIDLALSKTKSSDIPDDQVQIVQDCINSELVHNKQAVINSQKIALKQLLRDLGGANSVTLGICIFFEKHLFKKSGGRTMTVVGIIIFFIGWIYAISTYGFFLGLGLGWIPALFVAWILDFFVVLVFGVSLVKIGKRNGRS